MSNRSNNVPQPKNNGAEVTTDRTEPAKEEKKSILAKAAHVRDKIKATRFGRICIKGLKAAGVGGLCYFSYRAGKGSVKPTTIYVKEGVTEEEDEEPTETIDQETGEVIEE